MRPTLARASLPARGCDAWWQASWDASPCKRGMRTATSYAAAPSNRAAAARARPHASGLSHAPSSPATHTLRPSPPPPPPHSSPLTPLTPLTPCASQAAPKPQDFQVRLRQVSVTCSGPCGIPRQWQTLRPKSWANNLPDASPISVPVAAEALGNGRFVFTYRANVAGTYQADILLAGRAASPAPKPKPKRGGGGQQPSKPSQPSWQPIGGSPFAVEVLPAATRARACAVRVDSAAVLRAGQPVRVHIDARDRFFNNRIEGGDCLELLLRPRAGAVVVPGQAQLERGEVIDHGDGSYTATITRTVAAAYEVLLQLKQPPPLPAAAAAGDGEDEGGDAPPEGTQRALDQAGKGNPLQAAGGLLRRQSQARNAAAARVVREAATATVRGGRVHMLSSLVEVVPLATDAAACTVAGAGVSLARVLQLADFVIQPRDRHGNVTAEPPHAFSAFLQVSL